ncbi:complement factor H-related protein 1-like [Xiphias gladius]|uniref:complement factor H-related protein 1-like n=1 Tax=Xiphias gladius TaxID=8245 RepID=UPI001A9933AB|nr:complement factor H-related protein 1-like [Xiphias gladius]
MHLSFILLFLHLWGNVEVSLSKNVCSNLPDVPYAQPEYQEGDVINFTCESGYKSAQTSKYLCTSDGWLAVRQGKCYSCATLPDVPHAYISEETKRPEYQEGNIIHFTCESGYTSGSTIKYVCSDEGWLAVHQGACLYSATNCDLPPADAGVTVRGLPEHANPILPDHVLRFSCDGPGKYLNGSSVLTCGHDGQWDNPFPSCTDTCKVTGVPDNVHLRTHAPGNQLTPGQKLRFSCRLRSDFIQGKAEVECLENGEWSHPFPTCGAPLGCERPPPLDNGDTRETQKYRYAHNERVEYVCQKYHTMQDGPFKTCNNGDWTGEMRCLKPCTVDTEVMNKNNIAFRYTYEKKLYSTHLDYMEFACTRGRRLGTVAMRQRCIDGVIVLPTCLYTEASADSAGGAPGYGTSITWTITMRFSLLLCLFVLWVNMDVALSQTEPPGCETPPALADGDIKYTMRSRYSPNERVEYMCQKYYTMEGEPYRTCVNGEWTGRLRCLSK